MKGKLKVKSGKTEMRRRCYTIHQPLDLLVGQLSVICDCVTSATIGRSMADHRVYKLRNIAVLLQVKKNLGNHYWLQLSETALLPLNCYLRDKGKHRFTDSNNLSWTHQIHPQQRLGDDTSTISFATRPRNWPAPLMAQRGLRCACNDKLLCVNFKLARKTSQNVVKQIKCINLENTALPEKVFKAFD